jgi:hypothetical protein
MKQISKTLRSGRAATNPTGGRLNSLNMAQQRHRGTRGPFDVSFGKRILQDMSYERQQLTARGQASNRPEPEQPPLPMDSMYTNTDAPYGKHLLI